MSSSVDVGGLFQAEATRNSHLLVRGRIPRRLILPVNLPLLGHHFDPQLTTQFGKIVPVERLFRGHVHTAIFHILQ